MKSQALLFHGALAGTVLSAALFAAGWLWFDHKAEGWGTPRQRTDGEESNDAEWAESRYWSDVYLRLLKGVPASVAAAWVVAAVGVYGPAALRWKTIRSHFPGAPVISETPRPRP